MIRLARIATDPKWAHALHRDLIRDQQTLDGIGWLGLKAYIDHPPAGTALREAFEGPLNEHNLGVAQIVHAVEALTWNLRGINSGAEEWEPFPALRIPGATEDDVEPTADWSALDGTDDLSDLASPEVLALMRG